MVQFKTNYRSNHGAQARELDFQAIQAEVNDACSSKRGQYTKFTDADRSDIGQYASENGPAATVRKFSKKFSTLNESIVRGLRRSTTNK